MVGHVVHFSYLLNIDSNDTLCIIENSDEPCNSHPLGLILFVLEILESRWSIIALCIESHIEESGCVLKLHNDPHVFLTL